MIGEIRNTFWRRVALVFTVLSIVVCFGPARLVLAVLRWIETEFEADLAGIWRGEQPKGRL